MYKLLSPGSPTAYEAKKLELVEAIRGRRSIRKFKDRPVPRELIEEIIEAGTWAPSAKNGQQ